MIKKLNRIFEDNTDGDGVTSIHLAEALLDTFM